MDGITSDIIAAARRVIEAVEWDNNRAMLYIRMGDTEHGFAMDEKIKNPLAEAIVLLARVKRLALASCQHSGAFCISCYSVHGDLTTPAARRSPLAGGFVRAGVRVLT